MPWRKKTRGGGKPLPCPRCPNPPNFSPTFRYPAQLSHSYLTGNPHHWIIWIPPTMDCDDPRASRRTCAGRPVRSTNFRLGPLINSINAMATKRAHNVRSFALASSTAWLALPSLPCSDIGRVGPRCLPLASCAAVQCTTRRQCRRGHTACELPAMHSEFRRDEADAAERTSRVWAALLPGTNPRIVAGAAPTHSVCVACIKRRMICRAAVAEVRTQ